ncbi:MAG: magnesium transporter, partial [Candidatus Bathyarchaeia archaeon]
LGYVEDRAENRGRPGRRFALDIRQGSPEALKEFARQLAQGGVDLIFAISSSTVRTALEATRQRPIPILFPNISDPVKDGFAQSLARAREHRDLLIIEREIFHDVATLGKVEELMRGKELSQIYVVYPALIDTIGDVGAVVGSTATTKLALGTLRASLSSVKNHQVEILGAWTASLIMYFAYSVLALLITGVFAPISLLTFTLFLFTVNVFAAFLIILVSYSVAILTYQRGLDPDNFEIPIESSLADSITTISLLVALVLWAGVLA